MYRLVLLLVALALAWAPARAQRSLVVEDFRAEIRVRPDGVTEVTETLRPRFQGKWNGLLRDISLQHHTAKGWKEKLRLEVLGVTDEGGKPLRYEEESPDGWTRRVRAWVPGAEDATRTVVIRYRVENVLRFFEEECEPGPLPVLPSVGGECRPHRLDELYWNVTGNAWEFPIERARARIVLPEGVTPTQVAAYTGRTGSTASDAEVRAEGNVVTVRALNALRPGEGLTVGVGWPPGAVERPSALHAVWRNAPLALPFVVFALAFLVWSRRGRDPRGRPVAVAYEPPDGLTPAEVGTLVDHELHVREITATLVDLAVKGYVGIEEREEKKLLGLFTTTEYVFHLRRPRKEWGGLAPHERSVLGGVFRGGGGAGPGWSTVAQLVRDAQEAAAAGRDFDPEAAVAAQARTEAPSESVRLSALENSFYSAIPGIRNAVYRSLEERGYYRSRPDRVKKHWRAAAGGVAVAAIVAAVVAGDRGLLGLAPPALLVGLLGSAAVIFGFGLVMPARTAAGARARETALGFREFLEKVESDRYRRMITSPEMFERYLPYAMAFRVEERWAKAFEDLYREPPEWYSGGGGGSFHTRSFSSRMGDLSSRAESTMTSSPSSSSSGSGGGGSSGGGSGGGGGGGF